MAPWFSTLSPRPKENEKKVAWHYSFKLRNPKLNLHLPRLHPGARGVDLRHKFFMLHVLVISSLAHVFPQLSGSRTCGPWQQIRGPLQWGTGTLGNCWVWLRCYVSEWWGKHFKKNFLQGPFGKKPMFLLFVFFLQPNTFFCRLCWYFFSFSGGGEGSNHDRHR